VKSARPLTNERIKNMAGPFEGKTALVTGAASGIGRVTARAFAAEGARVIVSTDANIKGGGEATFVRCDVSKKKDVEELVRKTVEAYGSIDYAFNNAGVGPDGKRLPVQSIADCPEEIWDRTIDINLKGVWLCMKYEIRQMLRQGQGAIVNTSSVGGLKPVPGLGAYVASKSGVIGLTKTAAQECATSGIRVNVICPGPTDRTLLVENMSSAHPEIRERMLTEIPMGRLAEPEETAAAVIWLCSDAASFITGHVMPVDGGMAST
jgi:NAD(P)-dependent dehydrogenase (short-subunit alcohol dehydrogenase family)